MTFHFRSEFQVRSKAIFLEGIISAAILLRMSIEFSFSNENDRFLDVVKNKVTCSKLQQHHTFSTSEETILRRNICRC